MRTRWISLLFLFSLALGSCGSSQAVVEQPADLASLNPQEIPSQEPTSNLPENPLQSGNTPATMDMTSTPADLDLSINLAKQDLADRLSVEIGQIALLKTMEIPWPDISMGCRPSAGQILTKGDQVYGYRVWLEAKGEEYIYHIGLTGQVILCPTVNPGAGNPLLATPDGSTPDPQNQTP